MFRIKICGITNVEDAIAAVDAGADAVGLNFYDKSPRHVDATRAQDISREISLRAQRVGVFVNASAKPIVDAVVDASLSAVQLHGDETPSQFAHLYQALLLLEFANTNDRTIHTIRARRIESHDARTVEIDLKECAALGAKPHAVLVDAVSPRGYGGTGTALDWNDLAMHQSWLGDTQLILAGGLTPDNVAEAIRIVRPAAVDVASGVESAPGKKDPIKVRDFVAAARAAFG